ncbi:MAG: hypothetical protein ACTSV7_08215 [Candidatus Baldrarchaeia archaeon]
MFVSETEKSRKAEAILRQQIVGRKEVRLEIVNVNNFKPVDFVPPLLFTPEGSYQGLKQINKFVRRLLIN